MAAHALLSVPSSTAGVCCVNSSNRSEPVPVRWFGSQGMPGPLAPRETEAVLVTTVLAVVVIVLLFVWPGFLAPTSCASSQAPTVSANGRTYCSSLVPIPRFYANYTAWEFTFRLHALITPGWAYLNITITEPDGILYSGSMLFAGGPFAPPQNLTTMWFTPDNASGVTTLWGSGNASLLVEK